MKTNANDVLKVLILGAAILFTGGEVLAANRTGGFGGQGTTVNCQCIGGWGMSTMPTGLTGGVQRYATGGFGVGTTSHGRVGPGNALGNFVRTSGGGNDGGVSQPGSTGPGAQLGNLGGGTSTPNG